MRRVLIGCVLGLALGVGGCVTPAERIEEKAKVALAKWKAEHPGEDPSAEVVKKIWADAKAEVVKEMAEQGQGAITSIFSGNFIAAAFHAIGLLGIGIGVAKKTKVLA